MPYEPLHLPDVFRKGPLKPADVAATAEYDPFPGVSGTLNVEPGFAPIDPDAPALSPPLPDVAVILAEIRDRLPEPVSEAPVYQSWHFMLFATSGAQSFAHGRNGRNIFIAPNSRTMRVWGGSDQRFYLGSIPPGRGVRAKLPIGVDGVFISWDAGPVPDTIHIVLSSEPLEVNLV